MGSMNRVFLMGNVTRDPELRQTPSGSAVLEFGLAVSEKFKNKAGQMTDSVCFADVVAWDRLAEVCGEYLAKGSAVLIEGKLQYEQWQTQDGGKRSRLRVRASRVEFVGRPRKKDEEARPSVQNEGREMPEEVAQEVPF
jgi:single-strand DNA-binding protein